MPKAYSYLRFSTPEQMHGDSSRRQTSMALEYAAKHGLTLDEDLTYKDLGVSAFRGKNAEEGKLAEFLDAVRAGKVESGSYLLVESLDRISRQAAWLAMGTLTSILAHGITLVTLADGKMYSQATMTAQPWDLMFAVMGFIRANDESAHKSRRLKEAWIGKRQKATTTPLTSIAPFWLRLDKATGQWNVLPERAEVVRRIFRDYLAGHGAQGITVALNKEEVPPFICERRQRRAQAIRWHRSTIRRILENPAVIGTHTPHALEYVDGKRRSKPAQQPIPGYFPAIVDEDTFQRVQALRLNTPSPLRGRNASREVKNLFGGLARCGQCGATMARMSKGRNYAYLVCQTARYGVGCKYTLVPYHRLEAAFIQHVPRLLTSAPTDPKNSELDDQIRQVQDTLEGIGYQLSSLAEAYAQTRMGRLLTRMKDLEAEIAEMEKQRDALYERAGILACPLVNKRIGELGEAFQADTLDRRKVNTLMRMVLSEVRVHPDTCSMDFTWKNGSAGDSLLYWFPKDTAKAA